MLRLFPALICVVLLFSCSEDQNQVEPDGDDEKSLAVILQDEPYEVDSPIPDKITSEVRFVHVIPGAAKLDLWVDGVLLVPDLRYQSASKYRTIISGNRFLRLVPMGQDTSAAIFRRLISIRSLSKMTILFYGEATNPSLLITQERFTYSDATSELVDSADVKLINLNMSARSYKLTRGSPGSTVDAVPYQSYEQLSLYLRIGVLAPGPYYIEDAAGIVDTLAGFTLKSPGYRYTIVLTGPN